jgi:hypothetical protein
VPIEPTQEMVRAITSILPVGPYDFAALSVWKAMLAASPPAPRAEPAAHAVRMPLSEEQIRTLPAQDERVETGAVQFGDDWPGVFIRGDNAFFYIRCLDALLRLVPASAYDLSHALAVSGVQGLRDILASSDLTGISRKAESAHSIPSQGDETSSGGAISAGVGASQNGSQEGAKR